MRHLKNQLYYLKNQKPKKSEHVIYIVCTELSKKQKLIKWGPKGYGKTHMSIS
jgi:hypothetical protein